MSQSNNWTESANKALDIIKQNTSKISEQYLDSYKQVKTTITMLKVPLGLLTASNIYIVFGLPEYVDPLYVRIGSSIISALITGFLCVEHFSGASNSIETTFSSYKDYDRLSKDIQKVLLIPSGERKEDAQLFLSQKLDEYKKIIATHPSILKWKGEQTFSENMDEEELLGYLMDHWNIIYRPSLLRLKSKNKVIMDLVNAKGLTIEEVLNPPTNTLTMNKTNVPIDESLTPPEKNTRNPFAVLFPSITWVYSLIHQKGPSEQNESELPLDMGSLYDADSTIPTETENPALEPV